MAGSAIARYLCPGLAAGRTRGIDFVGEKAQFGFQDDVGRFPDMGALDRYCPVGVAVERRLHQGLMLAAFVAFGITPGGRELAVEIGLIDQLLAETEEPMGTATGDHRVVEVAMQSFPFGVERVVASCNERGVRDSR